MIFLTGDTHGSIDIHKLGSVNFNSKNLTKEDYVIILGDFGLVCNLSPNESYWRNWLHEKPFITLYVPGNHENYDETEKFPIVEMFGGKVRIINESIICLITGEVY